MTEDPHWDLGRIRAHLSDDVLGWWLRNGPDDECGGVFTCWDNRGERLVSTDKYTWSQGRWIWLMARTAGSGVPGLADPDRCLELARSAARFVRSYAVLPDHSTAFVTDRGGTPYEPHPGSGLHTSVFADCFVALGLAALADVTSDAESGELAEAILRSAEARIRAGNARTDPYPVPAGFASFALPMILTGTATEVYRATGSTTAAEIAGRAVDDIATVFRSDDETYELRASTPELADTLLARHRNPGHVLECLWFVVHSFDAVPELKSLANKANWLPAVARHALRIGWDGPHGGLFRFVDQDGGHPIGRATPDDPYEKLVGETWDTKLWWVHAEALYTTALLAERYDDPELAEWYDRLRAYTFTTFPAGAGREWIQIRARDGSPFDRTVALPVKDPFHIARALLLLVELLAERNTAEC